MLTKILVKADQHMRPLSSIPWSPTVQQAYLLYRFWTLTCMAKRTERNLTDAINKVKAHLDPKLIDLDPNMSLSAKLQCTQKALKQAKREADKLCQQHLDRLLNAVIAANQSKHSQALKYLI